MMSSIVVKLISDLPNYPNIELSSNASSTLFVGRNEQSRIETARCARQQGRLSFDMIDLCRSN
jgi:hypothetical protein